MCGPVRVNGGRRDSKGEAPNGKERPKREEQLNGWEPPNVNERLKGRSHIIEKRDSKGGSP